MDYMLILLWRICYLNLLFLFIIMILLIHYFDYILDMYLYKYRKNI
jgi:hypothetical protein